MKKLLMLIASVATIVACSKDQEMNITIQGDNDPVKNTITVGLDAETRSSSTLEAGYRYRYILEIYNDSGSIRLDPKFSTEHSVVFDVNLAPGCDYRFVAWVDIVAEGSTISDYYNTEGGLTNITIKSDAWKPNDDKRDAFSGATDVNGYSSSSVIDLTLTRPFAKFCIVAKNSNEHVRSASMYYSSVPTSYNARNHRINTFHNAKVYELNEIDGTTAGEKIIFSDYIFATEEFKTLDFKFTLNYDDNSSRDISDKVDIARNKVYTYKGNIL